MAGVAGAAVQHHPELVVFLPDEEYSDVLVNSAAPRDQLDPVETLNKLSSGARGKPQASIPMRLRDSLQGVQLVLRPHDEPSSISQVLGCLGANQTASQLRPRLTAQDLDSRGFVGGRGCG